MNKVKKISTEIKSDNYNCTFKPIISSHRSASSENKSKYFAYVRNLSKEAQKAINDSKITTQKLREDMINVKHVIKRG